MRQSKNILKRDLVESEYKPSISAMALIEVRRELEAYTSVVLQSDLAGSSKDQYIDMADRFVRWLAGEFTPGIVKGGRVRFR